MSWKREVRGEDQWDLLEMRQGWGGWREEAAYELGQVCKWNRGSRSGGSKVEVKICRQPLSLTGRSGL